MHLCNGCVCINAFNCSKRTCKVLRLVDHLSAVHSFTCISMHLVAIFSKISVWSPNFLVLLVIVFFLSQQSDGGEKVRKAVKRLLLCYRSISVLLYSHYFSQFPFSLYWSGVVSLCFWLHVVSFDLTMFLNLLYILLTYQVNKSLFALFLSR